MAKKLHISKTGTTVSLKNGRTTEWKVEGISLHPGRLAGLVAAQDPDTVTPEGLQIAIAAAIAKKGSIVPDSYRYQYGVDQNCGDDVALRLKERTTDGHGKADMVAVAEVASRNGLADKYDGWVSRGLNNGQLRMNLGNMLRGKVRKGEPVTI